LTILGIYGSLIAKTQEVEMIDRKEDLDLLRNI